MKMNILILMLCVALYLEAAQVTGSFTGRVLDEDHLPLPGANILVPALNTGAATDKNGEFRLSPLPTGRYAVLVRYIGFQTVTDTVEITPGASTTLNVVMMSGVVELDEVLVVGERLRGQARALNQQKENFNITNVVSADQIGRFPDQNIGDALKRIPGITVNYNQGEARYANIRGAGPGLSAVSIDGDRAPSADPETQAVQLDLIPAEMIQSIKVSKTVTPDMDGDAIGGSVNLITRQAPYLRRLSLAVGSGYNPLSGSPRIQGSFVLGNRFVDEKLGVVLSGSWDDNHLGSHNSEGIWRIHDHGAVLPQQWDVRLYTIRRLRRSFSAAADYRVSNEHRYFINFLYNHRDDWENRVRLRYLPGEMDENGLAEKTDIRRQTKGGPGWGRNNNARLEDQRTVKIQLKGKHNFGDWLQAEWSVSLANASEDRPNERHISWEAKNVPVTVNLSDPRTPYFYEQTSYKDFKPEEISEEFQTSRERNLYYKIDLDLPLIKKGPCKSTFFTGGKIKVKSKSRDMLFNRIRLTRAGKKFFDDMADFPLTGFNDRHFLAGDYTPGSFTSYDYLGSLDFSDTTLFNIDDDKDKYIAANYNADEDVSAAYLLLEQNLGKHVEIKIGMRAEKTSIAYRGFVWNEKENTALPKRGADSYVNLLPGLHLKYEPNNKVTIRAAWTNTVSRPNYYDLVPYRGVDRGGEVLRRGNPLLQPTVSRNFDFMIERYFKTIGIVSMGAFHKILHRFIYMQKKYGYFDPLTEEIYDEYYQPRNGGDAVLSGLEFAFQRQLDFLPGLLSNLGLYANYTFTTSRANSPNLPKGTPLPGAAPHILNLNVSYETQKIAAGLSFSATSPYIDPDEVDLTPGLERYYDKVRYLDFNLSWKFRPDIRAYLEAQNLLNQPLRYYAGSPERTAQQEFYSYRLQFGIKYSIK